MTTARSTPAAPSGRASASTRTSHAEREPPYASASGFADFAESDDILAEFLRQQAHARANARGPDISYRLPVDFLDAVNGGIMRLDLPRAERST